MSFSPKDKHEVIFTAPPVKRTCYVSHCCLSLRSTLCLKLSQVKEAAKWFNTIATLGYERLYVLLIDCTWQKLHEERRTQLEGV